MTPGVIVRENDPLRSASPHESREHSDRGEDAKDHDGKYGCPETVPGWKNPGALCSLHAVLNTPTRFYVHNRGKRTDEVSETGAALT